MCGIAGIFHFDPHAVVDETLLRSMSSAITHRGPDEDGFYINGPLGLTNRRLSIIGLADGRQPISNEDETIWTVFNGEIYNYPDLKRQLEARGHRFRTTTDTEVLVHLYEDHGPGFVEHLNGMFTIALWDDRARRLLVYRDRLGEKPLYYTTVAGRLVFASEIKAMLRDPQIERAVAPEALYDYLSFQYNPRRQTIFRGIQRLKPGTMLEVTADGVREHTYWEIPVAAPRPRPEEEYLDELRSLLRDSVRRRLLSDVPLGAFLSGGLDSSVVVGLMAEILDRPVQTFSVGFTVPGGYDESEHALRVARHFGTEHHPLVVESMDVEHLLPQTVHSLDEPIADFAAIPTYLVSQFARRSVTVVLTGEGADELFAGYDHYRFPSMLERYSQVPEALRRLLSHAAPAVPARFAKALTAGALDPLGGFRLLKSVFRPSELDQVLSGDVRAHLNGAAMQPDFARLFERGRDLDVLNRYLLVDLATWLPEDLLMKVDKMSMSVSLEARVPYLDHRIVELAATMPSDLKWRGGGKYILKRLAAGLIPQEIIERRKHGFRLPLDRWFRRELRAMAEDLLLGTRARSRGLLEPAAVATLWQRYLGGDDTRFMQVWTLLNLELWCRGFLDGDALRT